jgi:peptide/nickel transport system substrate-binding protein
MALPEPSPGTLSRRELLQNVGLGALAVGVGGVLGACSSSSSPSSGVTTSAKPKRGGTLTAGISGGSSTDTIDPLNVFTNGDYARDWQLYESLVGWTSDAAITYVLAEEITPNKDATLWTIRVKPGIEFHNGKELMAEDVVYSYQRILNPKTPTNGAPAITPLDAKNFKIIDKYTCQFPCTSPFSSFVQQITNYQYQIIPVGFDIKNPVGTGPFKYVSFTPGVQSVFTRNDNYWQSGLPYLDSVVITDFTSTTSQLDALKTGQIDIMDSLPPSLVASVRSAGNTVLISNGGTSPTIYFRIDQAPFSDPNVRIALKSLFNRQQMLDIVFDGYGTVGNDIQGPWDPLRDTKLAPRPYDPDYAKSLLKKAGHDSLSINWEVAEVIPGVTRMMEVYQEQAKAGNVNIALQVVTTSELYGPNLFKWSAGVDYWIYIPYMAYAGASMINGAYYNESHIDNSQFNRYYADCNATTNESLQKELVAEMQQIDYNLGGTMIPLYTPECDVYAPRIKGGATSKVGEPFNFYDFKQLWIE